MVREFFEEVHATESRLLAAVRQGQEIPQYSTDPVGKIDGEKEIGTLEDTWMRALCLTFKQRVEASYRLPIDPRNPAHRHQIERITDDLLFLKQIVYRQLRTTFGIGPDEKIDIRAGWKIVKVEQGIGEVGFRPEALACFLSEGIMGIVNTPGLESYGLPPETLSRFLRDGVGGIIRNSGLE